MKRKKKRTKKYEYISSRRSSPYSAQAHYNEKKEYAKELEVYESIKKDYPKYDGLDIEKYIERAKTLSEKK